MRTRLEGITVKVNGTAAASALTVESGKLKIQLTNAIVGSDKVTVEFKDAELADSNNNAVKDGIANN